jgi:hypothetical protein
MAAQADDGKVCLCLPKRPQKKKSHDHYNNLYIKFLTKKRSKAAGPGQRLWLLTTLSQAKALAGPAPMAWLGLAQTGPAWPGFRLKAGLGTSLITSLDYCLNTYDLVGCDYNMPSDVQNGTFTSCERTLLVFTVLMASVSIISSFSYHGCAIVFKFVASTWSMQH